MQMEPSAKPLIDRPSVASGRFYSTHAEKLEIEIANMTTQARKLCNYEINEEDELLALIAPHAGYVFSGIVAASAFMQIESLNPRKRVFLIGSSHYTDFNGASVYNIGHYLTPFGKIKVNLDLANQLIENSEIINFVQTAHTHEHSLEVLLPFMQYFWKNDFEIIPIIISTHSKEICKQLSIELQPYLNKENLFIVSSDFSHFPEYTNAIKVDKQTVQATLTGKPNILLEQIETNKQKNILNLDTSMCGWTSVLTLMYMTEKIPDTTYKALLYQNSGDIKPYGDTERVVGYQSIAITQKQNQQVFELSTEEKEILLETATKSIKNYHNDGNRYNPELENLSKNLLAPGGAFVSIYLDDELRGCIGRMHSKETALVKVISDTAVSAAFHDNRFADLNNDDFSRLVIEISVLTPMRKINDINEIELGKHGIYIKKDYHTGTFLPQVADNKNWTIEEFVSNCSRKKAGLGWDGWKEAELFIYEAIIFKS